MRCPKCNTLQTEATCGNCGHVLSVADDTLDSLIQSASVPNLASLFRKAKDQGVIGSVSVYGEGAPTS